MMAAIKFLMFYGGGIYSTHPSTSYELNPPSCLVVVFKHTHIHTQNCVGIGTDDALGLNWSKEISSANPDISSTNYLVDGGIKNF